MYEKSLLLLMDTLKNDRVNYKVAKLAYDLGVKLSHFGWWIETLEHEEEYIKGLIGTFPAEEPKILNFKFKPSEKHYVVHCYAPTLYELCEGLRSNHNLHVSAFPVFKDRWYYTITRFHADLPVERLVGAPYSIEDAEPKYQQALEKGLLHALKLDLYTVK